MSKRSGTRFNICPNMGRIDRISRFFLGLSLILISPLGLDLLEGGFVGWFSMIFGLANVISSILSWCFMYTLVGLSSLKQANSDDEDESETIDFHTLRRKTILGFGLVSIIVSILFISESYRSAKDTANRMELDALHDVMDLVSGELIGELPNGNNDTQFISKIFSEEMLLKTLYHFQDSMLIFVLDKQGYVSAGKNLDERSVSLLTDRFTSKISPRLSLMFNPDSSGHTELGLNHIEEAFSEIDGRQFAWSYHPLEGENKNATWVILAKESISASKVFRSLLSRLSISSVLVVWISVWGAVAVAFFIWKNVEASNQRALKAANTDPETGLANQRALKEYIETIRRLHPDTDYLVSSIKFRNLEDIVATSGSSISAEVQKNLAAKLTANVKPECKIARLNNGNFLMFAAESETECFKRFRTITNDTQRFESYQLSLEPTEVLIKYPTDVDNFDDLISSISALMVSALQLRKPVLKYEQSLIQSRQRAVQYASEINAAIQEHQFELYWQPKFNPKNNTVIGAEALIRWNHPTDGLLTPYHFLDIVEKSNARALFACFVIDSVARSLLELKERGINLPLSFNLNGYDVLEPAVKNKLKLVANQLGENINLLEIELTEAETSLHVDNIAASLHQISDMGYRIALDDFGTGMSSLSYSHRLPINTIKIDKSFMDQLTPDPLTWLPIENILRLAKSYDYDVVVEGVETESQSHILQELECSVCQGYYFAKPMPFDSFSKILPASTSLYKESAGIERE
ncbi:MAG: EAL domain-containing protein [Candidatus Bathyarchaeota archaeon]|nr:EAL domain-containing protein [Candidatus Bathyarchaeota archaeon]